jgi:predicted restriction endonuclease
LEKIQLTKSRRGQGIFKANVRLIENHCRVTGVSNIRHLRASHIKPWAASDNQEKLDGFNGLLLSPHVDHLFDRGFISFKNGGEILISKELNLEVLNQWSISSSKNVGSFTKSQSEYLDFHRDKIFQG